MATDWAADVKKYVANADDAAIAGIVRYCGIALRNRDSSLVSFSDKTETDRVRTNFLKKKLGLTQSDAVLDAAIAKVGDKMKADRTKNRVTVYYLLAAEFKKLGLFVKAPAAAKKTPAAKAPAAPKATAAKAPGATKPASKTAAKPASKTAAKAAGAAALVAGAAAAGKAAAKPAAKAAAKPAVKAAPKPAAKLVTSKSAPTKAVAVKAPAKAAAKPAVKKAAAKPATGAVAGTIAAGAAVAGAAVAAASGAANAAKDTAVKAMGGVGDAAGAAMGAAGDAAGKVGDIAGATVGAVGDAAGAAMGTMGNAAGTAAGAVTGAAGAAADKAAALFTPGGQTAKSDDEGGMGWLLWLLVGALVLFALWWMFMRGGNDSAASNAPATEAAATVDAMGGSASGAAADLAAAPAEGTVAIPAGAGVTTEMRDGKPVVKVYFDSGKTDVVPAFAGTAGGLKAYLDSHAGAKLAVSGYADPTGNAKRNEQLSKQRAQAVQAGLINAGIPADSTALVKPASATDATVSKEAARRVEVTVQ